MPGFPFPGRPGGDHDEPLLDMIITRRALPPDAPQEMHDLARMLAAGPAGEGEPRHLTLQSVWLVQCVTPARSARSESRRRARWAVTRTAPGVLPTIRATSAASSPATTRSMMISA